MKRRGVTLIELMVASGLLAVLTAVLFLAWNTGAQSWLTASRKTDRLSRLQLALRQLEKGLESSSSQGLAYQNGPTIVAFPVAYPLKTSPATGFVYLPGSSSPQWQKYLVYYFDAPGRSLRAREVAISSTNLAAKTTTPLPAFDDGSGAKPLTNYATSGVVAAEEIDAVSVVAGSQSLEVVVTSNLSQGGAGGGNFTLHSTTVLRN